MFRFLKTVFVGTIVVFGLSLLMGVAHTTTLADVPQVHTSWPIGPALEQGDTPECVGYAWASYLQTVGRHYAGADIYQWAHALNTSPETGTYIVNGGQALVTRHIIKAVSYTRNGAELLDWLTYHGPVVVGLDWYEDMDFPLFGIAQPTGKYRGGHAVMCYGFDPVTMNVSCQNSYGDKYGDKGSFKMNITSLVNDEVFEGAALPTP